jgi:hypothetical protein
MSTFKNFNISTLPNFMLTTHQDFSDDCIHCISGFRASSQISFAIDDISDLETRWDTFVAV